MSSMKKLLERSPNASRYTKVGQRAKTIIQQQKNGDVLHTKVKQAMRKVKKWGKQPYTAKKWQRMINQYNKVAKMYNMDLVEAANV